MNIIEKIRIKLRNWLIGDDLMKWHDTLMQNTISCKESSIQSKVNSRYARESLQELRDFFKEEGAQIAVDRHLKSPSWAVFCIQGKTKAFVHIAELPDRDLESIARFIHNFEQEKRLYDGPVGEREFINGLEDFL